MRQVVASKAARLLSSAAAGTALLFFAHAKSQMDSPIGIAAFGAAALLLGLAVFVLYPFQARRILGARAPRPLKDIFTEFYSQSGISWDEFEPNWIKVAEILAESPLVLRPSDRFDRELKYRTPFDDSNSELVAFAQEKLGDKFNVKKLETLDSLIMSLCAKGGKGGAD